MAKKTTTPKTVAPVSIDPTPAATVEEPKKLEVVDYKDQKPVEPKKVEESKRDNIKASKSTATNPVQVVHGLVAEMVKANPQVRRRDLVEAAVKAGCAYYTARTQVQVALKKMKAA